MDQSTQPTKELLEAIDRLPILIPDAEADALYGAGERAGEAWHLGVCELSDQAEDSKNEIESSFERWINSLLIRFCFSSPLS